jgi:5'-nucleotidase
VVEAMGELIPTAASVPEDETVVALLAPYAAKTEALLRDPVGTSEVDLDGDRARVRSEETNLGDAIADAMLWKTTSQGARVALHNGGGVRASIAQGPVSVGQILEVLPFGNEISLVTLTGRQLVDALENGVSQVETGAGRFPQVSGLRFSFDPAATVGARVRLVEVWDPKAGAYRALLPEETLVVATNDFLAGGGDGYTAFAAGADRYDTGWLLSDVLAEYVREHSPLRVEVDGRIRVAGSGQAEG